MTFVKAVISITYKLVFFQYILVYELVYFQSWTEDSKDSKRKKTVWFLLLLLVPAVILGLYLLYKFRKRRLHGEGNFPNSTDHSLRPLN